MFFTPYLALLHPRRWVVAVAVTVAFCCLLPAMVSAEKLDTIIDELQRSYEGIQELSADFRQETFSKTMGATTIASGTVYFKKPGKMRWEYDEPAGDILISDGTTIWLFQADLNQVIMSGADLSGSPLARNFLAGMGSIRNDFDISLADDSDEHYRLALSPKTPLPSVRQLFIDIDRVSGLVSRTHILDRLGNETKVSFSTIKIEGRLDPSLFTYNPPKGVVVIRP